MKRFLLFLFPLLFISATANGAGKVVVSIAPLHSLVQGVMGETGEADLLVRGMASPHGFQLKPSQIRTLHNANVVFYIDQTFETFLTRNLDDLPSKIRIVSMMEISAVSRLHYREGGAWEIHAHDDHDHEKEHTEEDNADIDPHLWLDPDNAVSMVKTIADILGSTFPKNKADYDANAAALILDIKAADQKIANQLKLIKNKPYAVFHDAYQYFERHFGLTAVGSIVLEPDELPSISRIREIRERLVTSKVLCIFKEPQFSEKLVRTVTEGSTVKIGSLDPIGSKLAPGRNLYVRMLEQMAQDIARCLNE